MPPGTELDYVEFTANVNVTHLETSADTVLTGNQLTFDGTTRVRVEFYCQVIEIPAGYYDLNVGLWDNGTLTRLLCGRFHNANVNSPDDVEAYGVCYLTPSAGEHTYTIRAYKSPGSGTTAAIVAAGNGVGDNFPPGFYRVTVA